MGPIFTFVLLAGYSQIYLIKRKDTWDFGASIEEVIRLWGALENETPVTVGIWEIFENCPAYRGIHRIFIPILSPGLRNSTRRDRMAR